MKKLIYSLALPLILGSCSQNQSFKTETGVEVSYIEVGEGSKITADSIAILYLKYGTTDSVLMETTPDQPLSIKYDPNLKAGQLQEVLGYLKVGDSVEFDVTAQNLFGETYQIEVPEFLQPTDNIHINMKLEDQMDQNSYRAYYMELNRKRELADQEKLKDVLITDGEKIDQYLAEQGIEATKTESGLRYVIKEKGSGDLVQPGDLVSIHYEGRLLNGEKFDSSFDRNAPFEFRFGEGQVISGWDEGIGYLHVGDKATLYIPSPLGYGARAAGPKIPAFSILLFEVEVMGVNEKSDENQ